MNDKQIPKINPEYTLEKFDNEILLYTEAGTQAVYLNDAAYAVWQLCQEGVTIEQMVHYLEGSYPDQKGQIKSDVYSALETLKSSGVIEFEDE